MTVLIIIFIVVSIILALSTIGYVATDVILEVRAERRGRQPAPAPVFIPVPEPMPEPEPEPEPVIETVEQIDADEADQLLSDVVAMKTVVYENGAGHGKMGIVNIGDIDQAFASGDTVTIAELKAKGLLAKKNGRVKILAHGYLTKSLTLKAESYSVQAIKMIELTGGTVIILKD